MILSVHALRVPWAVAGAAPPSDLVELVCYLIITHDLRMVARMADEELVMYAGKIFEKDVDDDVFYCTAHPFSSGLKAAVPSSRDNAPQILVPIDGSSPHLFAPPVGFRYFARCPYVMRACKVDHPTPFDLHADHHACRRLHHESREAGAADVYRKAVGTA